MSQIGPEIPSVEGLQDKRAIAILQPMKTIIDMLTGRSPNRKKIVKLGANANLGGVITKVNEIIDRLQV